MRGSVVPREDPMPEEGGLPHRYWSRFFKRRHYPDFPSPGETVTLEWQQNQQNFVITALE